MNGAQALLSAVMLSNLVGTVQADEGELGVTVDTTFVSKYIWHGFNFYGHDNAAVQSSVDVDFWGTGFGVLVWHSRATKGGSVNLEEFDYILYYGGSVFDETLCAMDYTLSWLYYDFFDMPTRKADLQEFMMQFSWPDLLPGKIVPSYTVGKLWPAKSSSAVLKDVGGWVHVLGFSYDWTLPGALADSPEQVVNLMADLTYNDGYGAASADHDWSHAIVGASTSFQIVDAISFTPALYYQISMDDSVNEEDEVWTSLSLTYQF